ncbi:hypothetical protein SETIT_9G014500v2, partial [Setaria italica]
MIKLHEVARTHQEKISSAPVPIVEPFALVLGRKPNHIHMKRIRLQAQMEASEQREAAARARADAAEQRAQALEGQVSTVVETNTQLQEEQQSQRDELSSFSHINCGDQLVTIVTKIVRTNIDT